MPVWGLDRRMKEHKHNLEKFYRRTQVDSSPRFFLIWKCAECPYQYTYDLVSEVPGGSKEISRKEQDNAQ